MSLQTNRLLFGDYCLDPSERILLRDDKPVSLTPKAFKLLQVLVENPGRILEKDDLMSLVWPDSFVEESNLSFTINLLRKTLGDSRHSPRYIETIPKRGYRFIADVTFEEVSQGDSGTPEIAEVKAPSKSNTKWLIGAGAAAILLVSGLLFAVSRVSSSSPPILSAPFSVEQFSNTGQSQYAAISPDGKYAVFSASSGDKQSLWLRNLDSSETIEMIPPSNDLYLGLTFSNSGNSVFFVRMARGGHSMPALYRIESFGGVPVKIIDFVNERVSLSPDDSKIAFIRCKYSKDEFCSAFIADANGENERRLLTTANGVHIWEIDYSPDGHSVAIGRGRYANDKNDSEVFVLDAETGEEKSLFGERFVSITGLDWMPDGSGILFSAQDFRDAKASIWFYSMSQQKLTQVTRDAASYRQLSLDLAADKLVAVNETPNFRLQVVKDGTILPLTSARELAGSFGGSRLVYATFDGEVWSMNSDGSGQRQITKSKTSETSLFVSADGNTIFFSADDESGRNIWRMNADGTDRRRLTESNGGFVVGVAADGKYIFYTAAVGGSLYRVLAEGGQPEALVEKALVNPAVSSSGKFVAHFVLEGMTRNIVITDLSTNEVLKTLRPETGAFFARMLAWSSDGRRLAFVQSNGGKNSLWESTLESGPEKIADLSSGEVLSFTASEAGSAAFVTGSWQYDAVLIRGLR